MTAHGPADLALLAAVPRQRLVRPHRVEWTERMAAAMDYCRGWLPGSACEIPAPPREPTCVPDGRPSLLALAFGRTETPASALNACWRLGITSPASRPSP